MRTDHATAFRHEVEYPKLMSSAVRPCLRLHPWPAACPTSREIVRPMRSGVP